MRLIIVDDHVMLASALSRMLDGHSEFTVVGVCADAVQALDTLSRTAVDVALVDLRLAGADGTVLIEQISRRWPDVAVLVLSGADDADSVRRAVDAGCCGYLLKAQPMDELIAAVEAVARGERRFAPEVAGFVRRGRDVVSLSPREVELLRLLVAGATTADIAGALFISGHTVRNHVKNVLAKLGAHSRAEAVAIALRRRLVGVTPQG